MTGEQIKERRSKLGMTQSELAEALGVAVNTVSRWELGTSPPEGARMLALALTQLEWQQTLESGSLADEMRASLRRLEKMRDELERLVAEPPPAPRRKAAAKPRKTPRKKTA